MRLRFGHKIAMRESLSLTLEVKSRTSKLIAA
jgi:hypothetical protein